MFELSLQVDRVYMDSCLGSGDQEMIKFCEFSKLVLSKIDAVESAEWFPDWEEMVSKSER